MKGPGQRYVRMIYSRDGDYYLYESSHGISEEVIHIDHTLDGWYITVSGVGKKPENTD